jgi:hypothetical protein
MLRESLRQDSLILDAELIDGLAARPEAPMSDAPLYHPRNLWTLLSTKEPKEPKKPRR